MQQQHRADATSVPTAEPAAGPTARPASDPAAGATPARERTSDPPSVEARAAARASLAAGRSLSLWWVCTGIAVVVLVTLTAGATPGGLTLAGLLAASALARAVLRPGPVALTVRSRTLDTAVLASLALGVGLLAQLIPTP